MVKSPLDAVVPPIAPGLPNVAPPSKDAFKLGTFVVEVTVNGAVPVETIDTRVLAVTLVPTRKLFATPSPPDKTTEPVVLDELSVVPEVLKVVKEPLDGVVPPILPGDAKVDPPSKDAFKFATAVVLATTNGAVPLATVLFITPLAPMVVKDPVDAAVPPIAPGLANVPPPSKDAFKFGTRVVLAMTRGAVPLAKVLVI